MVRDVKHGDTEARREHRNYGCYRSDLMHTEDGYIIQECLNGDETAFTFLVDKYKKSVYSLAYSRLHNFHDAQDITQEVFIRAYKSLQTLKRWDNFMGWLYRITINVCKTWLKLRDRQPDSDFVEDQDAGLLDRNSMTSYREKITHESIQEALESLPEMYREVLTLRYFGGMNIKEISIFIGTSPRTVDRRLKEALTQLKEETLIMMGMAKEQHGLPSTFTFRIAEMVKQIKIHPVSTMKGLPWGLSLVTGIIITVLSLNPSLNPVTMLGSFGSSWLPSESKVLKVGEIPVDITKISSLAFISSKRGSGNSGKAEILDHQNTFFLAPKAEGDQWTKKADMPGGRHYISCSALNGKIYAIGGCEADRISPRIDEYDPITDIWTKKADMLTAKWGLSTCAVNGKIYAIGGYPVQSTVEEYDPVLDKWTKKADMPTARWESSIAVVNGKIYVMGGGTGSTVLGGALFPDKTTSAVEEYDPVTDTWIKKGDMPLAFSGSASGVVKDKIYLMGGGNEDHKDHSFSTVWEYDPIKDTWTKKADMPTPRGGLAAAVVNNRVYAIGGGKSVLEPIMYSVVEEYNPTTDKWTKKADMPTARSLLSADTVNGKIYVVGGAAFVFDFSKILEEYDPGVVNQNDPKSIDRIGKLSTTWGSRKR
jgi:RNA polymerase sigma factor (sigma-70 family)